VDRQGPNLKLTSLVSDTAGVVQRRLQIVNISWGSKPGDAVGMHVAAWVLGESLMHLATVWAPAEVLALTLPITLLLQTLRT